MTAVLLVRLSAMGDLVHGLGIVSALHGAHPDWRLTFVTQAAFAPLLEGLPGLARVVAFTRTGGLAAVRRLRRELRRERYDHALDLQGNWKSAFVARLGGAREVIGAGGVARREPASRVLLHRALPIDGMPHPANIAWQLARALAPGIAFARPTLRATAAELARERAAVAALGLDPGRPLRVIVRTDPADPRALRPEQIAGETARSAEPVLHVLGPAECHLPDLPGAATLRHGPGEVRRLIALGELLAAAGGDVVGPDQGASHVLAAAGARTFVCFGAQDPRRTAPPAATCLRHPSPPPCEPCGERRCRHAAGPVCMAFTTADGVVVPNGLPTG